MLENLQDILTSLAAMLCGFAVGGTWVGVVIVPNESFDHMDHTRADRNVRETLVAASTPISIMLIAAAALSVLGGALGAGVVAGVSAFGYMTNRWTLAPRKPRSAPPGARQRKKTQRVVAVALSLIFGVGSLAAGIMAAIGI